MNWPSAHMEAPPAFTHKTTEELEWAFLCLHIYGIQSSRNSLTALEIGGGKIKKKKTLDFELKIWKIQNAKTHFKQTGGNFLVLHFRNKVVWRAFCSIESCWRIHSGTVLSQEREGRCDPCILDTITFYIHQHLLVSDTAHLHTGAAD